MPPKGHRPQADDRLTTAEGQESPKPLGTSEQQFTGKIRYFSKAVRAGTPILAMRK